MNTWRYYNHAMVSALSPKQEPNIDVLKNKAFWRANKGAILARYTTDFDCGYQTNWWYVIKDTPFDLSELKAKRRYEITKGIKNFEVRVIDPVVYKQELLSVQIAAFSAYPEKYRPTVDKSGFLKTMPVWKKQGLVFGAFIKETDELCGYAFVYENGECLNFSVLKANPNFEKYGVNAAIIYYMLNYFETNLKQGFYICDGERSINHETAFQDYLEKYFGFRKAYCRLNIRYNPNFKWLIKCAYLFKYVINRFDSIGIIHSVNSVLKMEKIAREKTKKV